MFVAESLGHARPIEIFEQGAGILARDLEPVLELGDRDLALLPQLIERRLGEGRVRADRQDQKQTDERASRTAWAAQQATGFGAVAP